MRRFGGVERGGIVGGKGLTSGLPPAASPAANKLVEFEVALLQAHLLGIGHSLGRCGMYHALGATAFPWRPILRTSCFARSFKL